MSEYSGYMRLAGTIILIGLAIGVAVLIGFWSFFMWLVQGALSS
jgi:hypothetical protein